MKKEPLTEDLLLENARLRAEVETLSSKNKALSSENETLSSENKTLSAEVETLSAENGIKSARIDVLSVQLDAKSAEVETLSSKNGTLSSENETLQAETLRLAQRIAYLERMLYGAKSDKLAKQAIDQPTLFDGLFDEAMDERDKAIADTAKEIKKEGEARRAKAKTQPSRPAKYQYSGLEERTTVLMPEGVNPEEYDIIGKDVTRILHHQAAKVWVEVIPERLPGRDNPEGTVERLSRGDTDRRIRRLQLFRAAGWCDPLGLHGSRAPQVHGCTDKPSH